MEMFPKYFPEFSLPAAKIPEKEIKKVNNEIEKAEIKKENLPKIAIAHPKEDEAHPVIIEEMAESPHNPDGGLKIQLKTLAVSVFFSIN